MDHTLQVIRIKEDFEDIGTLVENVRILKIANIIILTLTLLSLVAGCLALLAALGTAGAAILPAAILFLITFIGMAIKILTKAIADSIDDVAQRRLKRLLAELQNKADELRSLNQQLHQNSEGD